MNQNIILIAGKSATGKSLSLRGLKPQEGVIYCNCEGNKILPFPAKFKGVTVTDPEQIYQAFRQAERMDDIHTIVIDSLDFLMDIFETRNIVPATNTMKAWSQYAQYFKKLMQQYVAHSTKNVVMIAHTSDVLNETEMITETLVKLKGSIMNNGVEAYFTNVIAAKKVNVKALDGMESELLNLTDDEKEMSIKYVFQTQVTKDSVNERIRAPLGMWAKNEVYIDNNVQLVLDRIHEYYQ